MKTLLAKLLGISKQLLGWIIAISSSQVAVSLSKLLPIALGIVIELAKNSQLGNSDKQKEAIKKLSDIAVQEGIVAGTNILTTAVEMAVAQMKASEVK